MKSIKIIAAVVLLLATNAVSYYVGYHNNDTKNYEVAGRMSDLIRCYYDHLQEDSLIEDYGCFDELCGIFLWDDCVGEPIELDDYYYCY